MPKKGFSPLLSHVKNYISNQLLDNRHTGDPAMGVNEFQMPHALLMVSNEQRLHSLTTTLDQGPLVGVLCIIVNRSLVPS